MHIYNLSRLFDHARCLKYVRNLSHDRFSIILISQILLVASIMLVPQDARRLDHGKKLPKPLARQPKDAKTLPLWIVQNGSYFSLIAINLSMFAPKTLLPESSGEM